MSDHAALLDHQTWIGSLQPEGLVVSPAALIHRNAVINRATLAEEQIAFVDLLKEELVFGADQPVRVIRSLGEFVQKFLGWADGDLISGDDPRCLRFTVSLPDYHDHLRPSWVVFDQEQPLLLVQELAFTETFDRPDDDKKHGWDASPQQRLERLLRETSVPIGLLFNRLALRLVYAPRGESTGHVTFPVEHLSDISGRLSLGALKMLLSAERLFSLAENSRLPALLLESRRFQNTVSTELAEQVLAAIFELLRGFQAADDYRKGELLRDVLASDSNSIYGGLLTVLLRLVFILYAESRGLMSDDSVYVQHYAVSTLFEQLREDVSHYPDTMHQRYGAWGRLLALFRLVFQGGGHGAFRLPARAGYLFDPDRYPFLEGRTRVAEPTGPMPLVSDGTIYRVLNNLLILKGERLSYRTLDVEQIGSVYEAIMGFRLEKASGRSIAIKATKSHGAPVTINLETLLELAGKDRAKWLKEATDQSLTGKALTDLKAANTLEGLEAALDKKIHRGVTPRIVPTGSMILQPNEERRRSGSHYTPRTMTEPIVRKALEPVLKQLGPQPTAEQLLNLKVCDPAMGSGAFLVEACRQLGDELVQSWSIHRNLPVLPADEDAILYARRLIAQKCLYGVDKNPLAVDLAKLSLWLMTLAKDHPFTFVDHLLRCGDSLVGLTAEQIRNANWKPSQQMNFVMLNVRERLLTALSHRQRILSAVEHTPYLRLQEHFQSSEESVSPLHQVGDLVLSAFFSTDNEKKRQIARETLLALYNEVLTDSEARRQVNESIAKLRTGPKGIRSFHWEIEFPEVFERSNPGFDFIVGNPPFMGGGKVSGAFGDAYLDWLKEVHPESHGNADLVAHFFRRAFSLLRKGGTSGLIATNTISQGDTRSTGLRWIANHQGAIYSAQRRFKWPGMAAVVVSVIHLIKETIPLRWELDGESVPKITAFLFHAGGNNNPQKLSENARKSFNGSKIYGQGFLFDDTDAQASPLAEMQRLIAKDPRNQERIFPYIGGEEVNDSPTHSHHRYVINFGEMTEAEARKWPDLMQVVETRVKPERLKLGDNQDARNRKKNWWLWGRYSKGLFTQISRLNRVIVCSRHQHEWSLACVQSDQVYSEALIVFPLESNATFAVLQSRIHELWARFFGSSMKDDLRYTSSDCFETFPFPEGVLEGAATEAVTALELAGKEYYEYRAALMVKNNEGLTKTYNRFHSPDERSEAIEKLRQLHAAMDAAVLSAYGWALPETKCEFLLDYEEEEEDEESAGGRRRKKPFRYRWPDAVRDEVLAKLLELNAKRAGGGVAIWEEEEEEE